MTKEINDLRSIATAMTLTETNRKEILDYELMDFFDKLSDNKEQFMKFLQKLDKKLDTRQYSSWNYRLFFITCGVKIYINKIAGSQRGYANTTFGLATLPAIQQWEIK